MEEIRGEEVNFSGYLPQQYSGISSNPLLDGVVGLLSKSHSLSELRPNLTDYELSEEIEAFLNVLDKTKQVQLSDLKLPAELSSCKGKLTSQILEYLRFLFSPCRMDKSGSQTIKAEDLSKEFLTLLKTSGKTVELVQKLSQELYFSRIISHEKDLNISTDGIYTWIQDNHNSLVEAVTRSLEQNNFPKKVNGVHQILLSRSTKQFYASTESDESSEVDKLATSYYGYLSGFKKVFVAESTSGGFAEGLLPFSHKLDGLDAEYQRADLANQVALGVWRLQLDRRVFIREINFKLIIEVKPGLEIRGGVMEAYPLVVRGLESSNPGNGETHHQVHIRLPSSEDLVKQVLPLALDQNLYSDSDFDSICLYLDQTTKDFRFLDSSQELDSSVHLQSDNLYVLLHHETGFADKAMQRVIFVENPDPQSNISEQYLSVFLNRTGRSTIKDLQEFAYTRIDRQKETDYSFVIRRDLNLSSSNLQSAISSWNQRALPDSTLLSDLLGLIPGSSSSSPLICFLVQNQTSTPAPVSPAFSSVLSSPPSNLSFLLTLPSLVSSTLTSTKSLFSTYTPHLPLQQDAYFLPSDLCFVLNGLQGFVHIQPRISGKDMVGHAGQGHEYIFSGAIVKLSRPHTVLLGVWAAEAPDQPEEKQLMVAVPRQLTDQLILQGLRPAATPSPYPNSSLFSLTELEPYGASVEVLYYNKEVRIIDD